MTDTKKFCIRCAVMLTPENLVPDTNGRFRTVCRKCRNEDQVRRRNEAKARDAEEARAAAATAKPRTVIGEGTYLTSQERAYYRNDGNKHIPSKGLK